MLKLFHGSNVEIDKVDLSKCMPNKDFGCGFYTTLMESQAWRMAQRRARIAGGEPTVEWAIIVRNNRDRNFMEYDSLECNLDCKYDVVIGPVADDTVGLHQVSHRG